MDFPLCPFTYLVSLSLDICRFSDHSEFSLFVLIAEVALFFVFLHFIDILFGIANHKFTYRAFDAA